MKILVFGAGIIGSYLCHVLCENDHDVDLLARGKRKEKLLEEGLVLHHYFGGAVTTDHPNIVEAIGDIHYDVIFVPMQYRQMQGVLDQLAMANTDVIVCVGNNTHAKYVERTILKQSPTPKKVLFGFQPTGGESTDDYMVSACFGSGSMTIGPAKAEAETATGNDTVIDAALKQKMEEVFAKTDYQLEWCSNMDEWYKGHLAFVLPGVYLAYRMDCNLYRIKFKEIGLFLDACYEAYSTLEELGYFVSKETKKSYKKGLKRTFTVMPKLFVMAKSKTGEMFITNHCKHAVSEMEELSEDFSKLLGGKEDQMKAWKKLKTEMPGFKKLHKMYD